MERLHRAPARIAILLWLASLPALGTAQQLPHASGQSAADPGPVLLTVTVTDKKGNYVGGLDKNAFAVFDRKVPQEISLFQAQDEPAGVGVIFDFSASVSHAEREQFEAAAGALARFVQLGHGANEYFIIGFATRPYLLMDWARADKALEVLRGESAGVVKGSGATALFDACYLGIEKLKERPHRKRALLVFSDGMDSISVYSFKDVRERLRETGVLVYSIGVTGQVQGPGSLEMEGAAILKEFSALTGGAAVFPKSKKNLDAAFDRVAAELRRQYMLGFKPLGVEADGKWHQLKVKLTLPNSNLTVRTREGYYAARNPPAPGKP